MYDKENKKGTCRPNNFQKYTTVNDHQNPQIATDLFYACEGLFTEDLKKPHISYNVTTCPGASISHTVGTPWLFVVPGKVMVQLLLQPHYRKYFSRYRPIICLL
jgi:hypothetical protein